MFIVNDFGVPVYNIPENAKKVNKKFDDNYSKNKAKLDKIKPSDIETIAFSYNRPHALWYIDGIQLETCWAHKFNPLNEKDYEIMHKVHISRLLNYLNFKSVFTLNVVPDKNGELVQRDKKDVYIAFKIANNIKERKYNSSIEVLNDIAKEKKILAKLSYDEVKEYIDKQIDILLKQMNNIWSNKNKANETSKTDNKHLIEAKQISKKEKLTKDKIKAYQEIRKQLIQLSAEQKRRYNNRPFMRTEQHYEIVAKIVNDKNSQWGLLLLSIEGYLLCCNKHIVLDCIKQGTVNNIKVVNKDGDIAFSGINGFKIKELPIINLYNAADLQSESTL